MNQIIGTLQENYSLEEIEVHWEIPDFLSLSMKDVHNGPAFKFLNIDWYLKIKPLSAFVADDDVNLSLDIANVEVSHFIMCTFGVKRTDGSVDEKNTIKHAFSAGKGLLVNKFLSRNALLKQKSELMPSNKLTIVCKLKNLRTKILELTELNTLSENIKGLLSSERFCDVILRMKGKEFKAHKNILAARAPIFDEMMSDEGRIQDGIMNLNVSFDPESFQEFLQYIYSGKLTDYSFRTAFDLYEISTWADVNELRKFCLEKMKEKMRVQDFYDVAEFASTDGYEDLFDSTRDFFNKNYKEIITSDKWDTFVAVHKQAAEILLRKIDLRSVRKDSMRDADNIPDSD